MVASVVLLVVCMVLTGGCPCVAVFGSDCVACLRPLEGWRSAQANDNGRYPVTFGLHSGNAEQPLDIPCGKCIGCVRDHARAWGIRCYHESLQHDRCCFATFTYADPPPPSLEVADLQNLFKRMRYHGAKFRYFGCGELGSVTKRPHYHVIFFGDDFLEGSVRMGAGPKSPNEYYVSPWLTDVWERGHVTIAPAEPATIFYTTGYTLKNLGCPESFHLSSRKPYIGHGWLEKYFDDISRNGFVTVEGKKVPIPPSYLKRKEFALEFQHLVEQRKAFIEGRSPEEVWNLRAGKRGLEKNILARAQLKRREL